MAKILFVHPAGIFEKSEIRLNPSYPPLGIAYLASFLLANKHSVRILDILGEGYNITIQHGKNFRVGLPFKDIQRYLGGYQPDIIGITNSFTKNSEEAHITLKKMRSLFPESFFIMGGAHCSVLPGGVINDPLLDAVCIGEGEMTMLEIANAFDHNGSRAKMYESLKYIPGIAFKKDETTIFTKKRKLLKDADTIPFPARQLLPMENYFVGQDKNPFYYRHPITTIVTSRGCPNNCMYCSVKSVWGRSWRGRSAESVVDEIVELQQKYGVREVAILDDSMSCNLTRLKNICHEIINRNINIKWCTPNGIAIWLLDEESIELMKKAGCYRLTFGLESGDSETSKIIKKKYDKAKAIHLIKYANKIGIWTIGTFIIGFPWEKRSSIENTFRYAMNSHVDLAVFYSAYPFPGTELHTYFRDKGLSLPLDSSVTTGGIDTLYMTGVEIARLRNSFIRKVARNRILHFYRIFYKIHSLEDIKFVCRIAKKGLEIVLKPHKKNESTSGVLKD